MVDLYQRGSIDPDYWPHVAEEPQGMKARFGAKKAESEFAAACQKAGLRLDGDDADLIVVEASLFSRMATDGWLGIAESFMAAEWQTDRLADVLTRLLEVGFHPKSGSRKVTGPYTGTEVPPELVRLTSGDGMSAYGTLFASGVPTRERTAEKSFVPGAGRSGEPALHFVDVTTITPASFVEKADLRDAQIRAATHMLDTLSVGSGTHVLDYPSAGAALPIAASRRKATVDAITSSVDQAKDTRKLLDLAQVHGSVHVELSEQPFPHVEGYRRSYDAIVSLEKLELMGPSGRRRYAQTVDAMLAIGGVVGLQTVVATSAHHARKAADALAVCNAYIWPSLQIITAQEVHKLFDEHTNIRITGQQHFGSHYAVGLGLQRETFEGRLREAAAEGFDSVYRRLWVFQLAMREALFRTGYLDAVQFNGTTRTRRKRR